ncbi:MAG: hypothetical protein LPK26_01755 [Bacillaceae bacterium]|nr:hypothetical protein [Bacillaceae bacterium]
MGTSSIFNGPKDKNPLLPEGFEDEYNPDDLDKSDQENQQVEMDFPWQATKTAMSQFVTGKSNNKGRVAGSYVKALGGANNAARSASSARRATIQLGRFLSDIINDGLEATFNKLNIDYRGRSVESLFSEIVNVIAGESNSKEDIAAKNASMEALSELYDFVEENKMDLQVLEQMDEFLFNKVMNTFIGNYLIQRLLKDLQSRFEKYADNLLVAITKENDVKEYIIEAVDVKLDEIRFNNFEYRNTNIEVIIEGIYVDCYKILEDYV